MIEQTGHNSTKYEFGASQIKNNSEQPCEVFGGGDQDVLFEHGSGSEVIVPRT